MAQAGRLTGAPPIQRARVPAEGERRSDERSVGDITFFVAADTHYGYPGIISRNRRQIRSMNRLPGRSYPPSLGGRVSTPRGVLIAGDLTNNGSILEWTAFRRDYGHRGGDGLLSFPVYEGTGNHDSKWFGLRYVPTMVRSRHGGLLYALKWADVQIYCLDIYPNAEARAWLRGRLRSLPPETPVVLYFHYGLKGPFSDWWSPAEKQAFGDVIKASNVIAIFHGHFHGDGHYRWQGIDVFNVGSPRHGRHTYAVARISGHRLSVASRNWARSSWRWWHEKRIQRPALSPSGAATPSTAAASP